MSLVQPTRAPNTSGNNVGVKRPYQLMINSAAHNSTTDTAYPGRLKNIKLDKDVILEDLNEENMVCYLFIVIIVIFLFFIFLNSILLLCFYFNKI